MDASMATNEASSSVNGGDGDKNLEEKKVVVTEKLLKREEERLDNVQKRREAKESEAAVDESTRHFTVNFSRERQEIERDLIKCESLDKCELSKYFDKMSIGLLKLQKCLADATMYLPSYEVRHAHEAINKLQTEIQDKREKLLPKKKFTFKSKKKTADKLDGPAVEEKPSNSVPKDSMELAECKFVDISEEKLEMSDEELNFKDVALARLTNCKVLLKGSPKAVHVRNLRDCQVFCGPVGGSIFITDCLNCLFVLPCQQLRIHTTKDTKFYIHVTSKAIIEDSSSVEFAPYNWNYDGIDEHYKLSGLNKKLNNWNLIDDFNWLAADKHSPNWSLISENDQVKLWESDVL